MIAPKRSLAADTIGAFKFDLAVIGCSAIDAEGDLLDFDIHEVGVSQAVLRQPPRAYLLADHSKLKRTAPARIASLAGIDMLFTDAPLPAPLAALCRTWAIEVVVAETAPLPCFEAERAASGRVARGAKGDMGPKPSAGANCPRAGAGCQAPQPFHITLPRLERS